MFHASVITLYPDMFPGPLGGAIHGRALNEGLWQLDVTQLRDFATDKHRSVDDTPAGGGAGLVLKPDVAARAIDQVQGAGNRPIYFTSPRGVRFDQKMAQDWAQSDGVIILCGRFEGLDERVIEARNIIEVSIGDFVLSGGEVAAMAMLEASVRLIPGVMGSETSAMEESFSDGLLEYPHYTRPKVFEERAIPAVLTSGNHQKIAEWRHEQALKLTKSRRPDLFRQAKAEKNQETP